MRKPLVVEHTQLGNVSTDEQAVEFSVRTTGDAVAWSAYKYEGMGVASGHEPTAGRGGTARAG